MIGYDTVDRDVTVVVPSNDSELIKGGSVCKGVASVSYAT